MPTAQPMFQDTNNNFSNDLEAEQTDSRFAFDDQSVRKAFIRKVYLILMVRKVYWFCGDIMP